MKERLRNIGIALGMGLITLVLAELTIRWVLFGQGKAFSNLRRPELYARNYPDTTGAIFSEEYWKLYTLLGGAERPPATPHPLLGWVGHFDRTTYAPMYAPPANGRRPVLLFGDSFAQCVEATCFEDILNADSAFAREHYLVNYGVGGYGLDQIDLLYRQVVDRYEHPFIVFSMMTRDMERAMFSARIGEKPFFTLRGDSLALQNVPIDPDARAWFADHGPGIPSYLGRLVAHVVLKDSLASEAATVRFKEGMRRLNEALMRDAIDDMNDRHIDHLVLVFEPMYRSSYDPRYFFLRDLLEEMDEPYLFTGDLVRADGLLGGDYSRYEQTANGHPTEYQNRLISRAIERYVLHPESRDSLRRANAKMHALRLKEADPTSVEHFELAIRRDEAWWRSVLEKARDQGVSADSMLHRDAVYMHLEAMKQWSAP
ncbi:MAG: hypothetical protein H6595_06030 [Flavobacteriales bacterium]|nr:hypothetical protein [Flavobacteriales bacterium]MCB9167024.1 hypothetical protein [Flavobacteriales bacterium]